MQKETKRLPNWKLSETELMLREIVRHKDILFAPFSSNVSFDQKTRAWNTIHENLSAASWPRRPVEAIKKRYEKILSDTKISFAQKNRTGAAPVDWNTCNDLILDIIGRNNPKLSSIPGGLDTCDLSVENGEQRDHERELESHEPRTSRPIECSRPTRTLTRSGCKRPRQDSRSSEYLELLKEEHREKMEIFEMKKEKLRLQIKALKRQVGEDD